VGVGQGTPPSISSFEGSAPLTELPRRTVIPGWDRSVKTMHVGEKRRIVVPASLGYGEKGIGPIPGGANLYFEVELLELKPMPTFTEKQLEWLATHPEP